MAEKTIGIRIQLNGIDTVITDIKTLENEIRKAKEDLKQVEIGGPIFKKLATEISQAETKLQGLQDSARGISKEKTLEGFGKLGAGISSSFAAATAAVSLFGKQSESVQKAAVDAQNLLTIALSLRGIAEIKTGADIVARTIAEKASTLATNASNSATKALLGTLSKNPYALIIAAVGALILAYVNLRSETTEITKAIESQKKIEELTIKSKEDLIRKTTEQSIKLRALQLIVNDTKKSELERNQALNDLKKELPGLTGLELGRANSLRLINAEIENGLSLGKLEIQSQAIIAVGIEKEIRLRELKGEQDKNNQKVAQIQKKIDFENRKDAPADYSRQERIYYLQKDQKTLKDANIKLENEAKTLNRDRNKLESEYDGIIVKVNADKARTNIIVDDYNKNLKDETKNTKDVNKVTQDQIDKRQDYLDLLVKEIKLNSELLVQTTSLRDLDNKIIDDTQKKIDTAQSYANTLNNTKTFTQLVKEATDDLLPSQDKLAGVFNQTKIFGEYYIESLDMVGFTTERAKEATLDFNDAIKRLGEGLSEEDQVLLQDFANNYKEIFNTFQLLQQFKGSPLGFSVKDFQQVVTDVNLALGKITTDPYAETRSAEQLSLDKRTAKQRYEILKESFVKEYELYLESQLDRKKLTNEEFENAKKKLPEIAASSFESFAGLGNELLKFEQGVTKTATKVIELNQKLKDLAPAAKAGFIIQNADEIAKQYDLLIPLVENEEQALADIQIEIAKKTFDEKKKYLEATLKLQADLLVQGIDIETLSYEQRLVLLEKFLGKAVGLATEETNGLTDEQEKFLKKTLRVVDEFASTIGRISSLVAQSYSFQLQTLETKNKEALSQVTGDTEEANEKRIELESQYQKQRAQIEKAARIKSLQFQKVQAITDVASASLKTFAELGFTPAGFVLVGIGAVLAAVQIGLIQQQINDAQSMAGGGRIRMGAGGIVMGPSHEQGGVSFASGGVNLEGGESVINRQSSMNYGGLLSSINQMGGGQPLVNNPSNSLSEERLVQAIAKSRQEPIRAYVMNSEITKGQAINRRLEELSTI